MNYVFEHVLKLFLINKQLCDEKVPDKMNNEFLTLDSLFQKCIFYFIFTKRWTQQFIWFISL